jgi:hypothetical protein
MEIEKKLKELEEKIEFLMFRQDLLFYNSAVDRILYEYGINKKQYNQIMDLMDEYSEKIGNKEKVNHVTFEEEVYRIVPEHNGNYHFVESLTRAFWEDGRWEEVFETLYGKLPKYKYLKKGL